MTESIAHIVANSRALTPISTGCEAELPTIPGIRAVAFDIYGTLVISGSGDIGVTDAEQESSLLRPLLADLGAGNIMEKPGRRFRELIEESHAQSRADGVEFPEVDILEIWQQLLKEVEAPLPDPGALQLAATTYEVATNPVWPMPGALETITSLRQSGISLGIVSNAQFYTPLLFEAFWEKSVEALGFDPELCFYSYQSRQAKPGVFLYEGLRNALLTGGIEPKEVLYVGNDMLKDIHPAASLGFRTALFAGDKRSLRLRKEHEGLHEPDCVITSLPQILEIVS